MERQEVRVERQAAEPPVGLDARNRFECAGTELRVLVRDTFVTERERIRHRAADRNRRTDARGDGETVRDRREPSEEPWIARSYEHLVAMVQARVLDLHDVTC